MQRFVSRSAAGYERDLAGREVPAANELALLAGDDDVRMRGDETVEALVEQSLRRIEKFLHDASLMSSKSRPAAPPNSPLDAAASRPTPAQSPCPTIRARRRVVSRTSSSKLDSFSHRRNRRLRVSDCADSASRIRRLPLGWARLKASRNARLSEGGKWQISKMISRCGAGIGDGIGRVGHLGDETAVLAQRGGGRCRVPEGR